MHGLKHCHSPVPYSDILPSRSAASAPEGGRFVRHSPGIPARQDRRKGQVEFREGPQHSTQGPWGSAVGQLRQLFLPCPRGLYFFMLIYSSMYCHHWQCHDLRYTCFCQHAHIEIQIWESEDGGEPGQQQWYLHVHRMFPCLGWLPSTIWHFAEGNQQSSWLRRGSTWPVWSGGCCTGWPYYRNLNVLCESGMRYPSLVTMLNRRDSGDALAAIGMHRLYLHTLISFFYTLLNMWYTCIHKFSNWHRCVQ